ncbi:amidohydrolase family protein [Rhodopirellula halodulae]|uniref:amidohydrolase family protein n=1 Tax=Rhodopirellula halodulae TaxID=2894198 RepID=UPI001E641532|nr:amidohydrolase family protein [Rhodopirellula sp. JC737]MCC9655348.1 amidohydrolase family protein [Rhodopirellula sp. JC737]
MNVPTTLAPVTSTMNRLVGSWLSTLNGMLVGCAIASYLSTTAHAHDIIPGKPQTQPVVIQHATLHVGNGSVIENGSVLFRKDKIVSVGASVAIPGDAMLVDASGQHVYPGLIDAYTDLGLREITAVDVTVDNVERGEMNPNVRSWVAFNPDSELIPVARSGGVLMTHVVPGGRLLQGQSGVLQLDGWSARDMLLSGPAGMCINWDSLVPRGGDTKENAKRYNDKIRELDELLERARRYAEQDRDGAGFQSDVRLESLVPVIEGKLPVFVQADRFAAIDSAISFFTSRQIPMVLCGGADAMHCVDRLTAHDIPVILIATYRLPRRRHDAVDALYSLPAKLRDAGVRFAIAGEGAGYPGGASNVRNLPYHAGVAVAHGLPHEEAVRAITQSPAEILGVADRVGSLAAERDATLILVDGDVLETGSRVVDAYVQGRKVDLSNKHKQLYRKYEAKP